MIQQNSKLIPKSFLQKIEAYNQNTPATWTALLLQNFIINLMDTSTTSLPISIHSDQKTLSLETFTLTTQTKNDVIKCFTPCSCDEINSQLKDVCIFNVYIDGFVGIQYQVLGFQCQGKMFVRSQLKQILNLKIQQIMNSWRQFQRQGEKVLNKKMACSLIPIFQTEITVLLTPKPSSLEPGFIQTNSFHKKIPIMLKTSKQNSQQVPSKIINIIEEQLKLVENVSPPSPFSMLSCIKNPPKKIFNPHLFAPLSSKNNFQFITVKGIYEYYHYGDQNFNDNGWGCAYRALQTLLSWLHFQDHLIQMEEMISIRDIQNRLDMIDRSRKLKGSSEWIGATQISWIVPKMTNSEMNCKILHVSDGNKILEKCEEFKHHFLTSGCPIMYGGDQYAYSIVGMYYNWKLGECEFLILDPHYTGSDDYGKILEKKGLAWRKPQQMFKKGIFYNFCLPIVPQ